MPKSIPRVAGFVGGGGISHGNDVMPAGKPTAPPVNRQTGVKTLLLRLRAVKMYQNCMSEEETGSESKSSFEMK